MSQAGHLAEIVPFSPRSTTTHVAGPTAAPQASKELSFPLVRAF